MLSDVADALPMQDTAFADEAIELCALVDANRCRVLDEWVIRYLVAYRNGPEEECRIARLYIRAYIQMGQGVT